MEKSRDITDLEWYSNIQTEYLSYKLRENIYERECDEKKFNDICRGKKQKIKKFALKNQMDSIFTSKDVLDFYISKLENNYGLPNFQYTPKTSGLIFWDKNFFFKGGVEIEFDEKEYSILRNFPNSNEVEVLDGREIKKLSYSQIKRNVKYLLEDIH